MPAMKRQSFPVSDSLKPLVLQWAGRFPLCAFLDSCATNVDAFGRYEFLAGVSSASQVPEKNAQEWSRMPADGRWHFTAISYEVKNETEPVLRTGLPPFISFPRIADFAAEVVIKQEKGSSEVIILAEDPLQVWEEISRETPAQPELSGFEGMKSDFDEREYERAVHSLLSHIEAGDCYEINFCRHFGGSGRLKNPAAAFAQLVALSPVPFAAYMRLQSLHILSASPERFLLHRDGQLVTQPIKGTAPRSADVQEDERIRQQLQQSEKERAENVMIVDLSRNDLYRSCTAQSVQVPRLWEVQSFAQVHQLVSTITGELKAGVEAREALLSAFPPGSMTGAPKVRVCQLADAHERTARGIYSGCIGYADPDGNFDFNVVIRTLVVDESADKLSFHTGGAITWLSDPVAEWEETQVKAAAILTLLDQISIRS